jgi:hypothetical protein
MAKSKTVKFGTVRVWKGGQDIHYSGLLQMAEHKLRIEARFDSYRDQSFAKIERWNGSEWKPVYFMPGAALVGFIDKAAYRQQAPAASDFQADVNFLIARAEEVLFDWK